MASLMELAYAVWQSITNLTHHIFFLAPLHLGKSRGLLYSHVMTFYVYLFGFVLLPFWLVPWTGLATWYVLAVKGCESHAIRPYVEGICMQPYHRPYSEMPRYLDLWNYGTQNAMYSDTLPPHIQAIMITHRRVYDVQADLLEQKSKLYHLSPAKRTADKLQNNLGSVTTMLSDLGQRWEIFSQTFCLEKDNINHAFRTLIETYAAILTSSLEYHDVTLGSVVVFPTPYMGRFINSHFLSRLLPKPKLYSLQVNAEIRFRMERFIDEAIAALERIDAVSPATPRLYSSTTSAQILEAASATTTVFQHELQDRIAEFSLWRQWIQKPKDLQALKVSLAAAERVHGLLSILQDITVTNEAHSRRLRKQLQNFRQSVGSGPSFQSSSMSLTATPGLVNPINGTSISAIRSEIGRLCKERTVVKTVPRELNAVCLIDALSVSLAEIDDDTLENGQRSLLLERNEEIHRYEVRTKTDQDSHIDMALKLFDHIEDGGSMPAYF